MGEVKKGQHGEPWFIKTSPNEELFRRAVDCVNKCDGHDLEQSVIVPKAELEALRECALLAKRAIATCSPHTAGCIAAALAKLDAAKEGE